MHPYSYYVQSISILLIATTTICSTVGQQQNPNQQHGHGQPPRNPVPHQIPPHLLLGGPHNHGHGQPGKILIRPTQQQHEQHQQQQQQQQQRFIPSPQVQSHPQQQQQQQQQQHLSGPATAAQQQIHRISAPPQAQPPHYAPKPPPPPPKYSSPPSHQNRINDPPPPKYKQQQQQAQSYKQQPQQQKPKPAQPPRGSNEDEEYYDDDEENSGPDKLTLLLQNSKFACGGSKKDGYYADDSLDCQVFHYCQDGKKHSWMCPEGFQFHQIHLICLPPSTANICAKSQSYHFINDYLYRPINEKEAAATNTSLRYADRYYPEDMDGEYVDANNPPHQPKPQQVQQHKAFNNHFINRNSPSNNNNNNNFYNSPESVNIPLSYRTRNVVNAQQVNRDSGGGGGGNGGGGHSKEQGNSQEYDY